MYLYIYSNLQEPENTCIVTTMVQLSERCGLSVGALQKIFKDRNIHYDNRGGFKIEKRIHYKAKSKIRNK